MKMAYLRRKGTYSNGKSPLVPQKMNVFHKITDSFHKKFTFCRENST